LLILGVAAGNLEELTAGWKQDAAPNPAGLVEIGKRLVLSLRRNSLPLSGPQARDGPKSLGQVNIHKANRS
jgi:hypothetical protein